MYDRQYNVYLKYKEIEKMPQNFGSVQTRETQKWVKDFINRVNEEVAESYESIRDPNTQVLVDKEVKKEDGTTEVVTYDIHRSEELADALHFYLEMLIIIGKTPEWLIRAFEEYTQRGRRVYVDDIILNYWEVSYQLGMLGNCLKLKPWKQDEVLTDLDKVDHQLKEIFFALLDVFAANGNDYNDIYDLYTRKNKVNQFRQREWVLVTSLEVREILGITKTRLSQLVKTERIHRIKKSSGYDYNPEDVSKYEQGLTKLKAGRKPIHLTEYLGADDRYWVRLNGTKIRRAVYVWEKYNGPIPKGYVIHHKDENHHNDNIENLQLVTRSEHGKIHGVFKDPAKRGPGNTIPKITKDKYQEIQELYKSGKSQKEIAEKFEVHQTLISKIIHTD